MLSKGWFEVGGVWEGGYHICRLQVGLVGREEAFWAYL